MTLRRPGAYARRSPADSRPTLLAIGLLLLLAWAAPALSRRRPRGGGVPAPPPSPPAAAPARRHLQPPPLTWIVLVAVLLPTNMLWGSRSDVPLADVNRAAPPAPIRIEDLSFDLAPDGATLSVAVEARNAGPGGHRARIWWQLTPDAGRGSRWDRRAYESAFADVYLAAGESRVLTWEEEVLVPPGRYEVDVWARFDRGGTMEFSDTRSSTPRGDWLGPRDARLVRRGPARAGVAIVGAAAAGPASPTRAPRFEVHLENGTDERKDGWLHWSLSPVTGTTLADWPRWAGATGTGRYAAVLVPPRSSSVVGLDAPRPLTPGTYALRVSLGFDQPARPDLALWPDDDVLVLVEVPPPPEGV